MDTPLQRALLAALALAPASQRELCRAADVDHSHLARILKGQRPPSRIMARRLTRTLRQWSAQCDRAATMLSRALTGRH